MIPLQVIPCPLRTFPTESSKTQRVSDQKLGNKSRSQIGKVIIGVMSAMTSSMRLQRTLGDGLLVSIKEKALTFSPVFPIFPSPERVRAEFTCRVQLLLNLGTTGSGKAVIDCRDVHVEED